jgi:hypothetical protein
MVEYQDGKQEEALPLQVCTRALRPVEHVSHVQGILTLSVMVEVPEQTMTISHGSRCRLFTWGAVHHSVPASGLLAAALRLCLSSRPPRNDPDREQRNGPAPVAAGLH